MHPIFSSKNLTRFIVLILSIACFSLTVAETVYVDDRLRVGVRKEPGNRIAPHAIVYTGMKLEILEEDDGFIRIRTDEGIEGWVKKTYTTSDRPAKELLEDLKHSYNDLKNRYEELKNNSGEPSNVNESSKKLEALQKQNNELNKQIEGLNKQISNLKIDATGAKQIKELQKQNEMLENQLMEMESSSEESTVSSTSIGNNPEWFSVISINLLMLLAGFSAGFLWFRRQMIRRLEGAEN